MRKKIMRNYLPIECFVLKQLVIFTKLDITFTVPNMAPFVHLLLYFIKTARESGASV